jgi:hypothetical protein
MPIALAGQLTRSPRPPFWPPAGTGRGECTAYADCVGTTHGNFFDFTQSRFSEALEGADPPVRRRDDFFSMLGQIRETLTMAFLSKTKSAAFPAAVILHAAFSGAAPVRSEDIADCFPNLKMPPILAATTVAEEEIAPVAPEPEPWHGDFARIVEEAKREAMGLSALGRTSVTAAISTGATEGSRGFAQFASQRTQPGQPAGGVLPPRAPTASQVPPGAAARAQTQPSGPASAPTMPQQPGVVPLPEAAQAENAIVPQVPADVQRALNNQFARSDVGGLRENWSDAPNIVGDGCAPQGSTGKIPVGRICVIAPGLSGSPLENTGVPAQLNVFTNPNFNNVQAIKAAGYPALTLPTQALGNVSGTPPTTIPGAASPGAGILGVGSPSSFTASADNAFATSPNLNTSQYANLNPTTVYNAEISGALPNPVPPSTPATYDAFLFYDYIVDANIVLPGYAVGFVKLTENQSPIPRDRVYMTYSYFSNANFYPTKADVNRFMPGFEKTFYDGWTSVEIRTPFAATLGNSQQLMPGGQGVSEYRDIQFGNMSVIFKSFIWETKTWALTGGMQVMLPTANNTFLNGVDVFGNEIQSVYVANESVHLMPFVGGIWAPNERFFNQILVQYEKDANGNLAYVNNDFKSGISGRQLNQAGRIFYPDFLYLSFGTGYWLYKDNTQNFTGFAPVMEIHVNQGLGAYCPIHSGGYQLGPNLGVVSVTNALVGCNFEWGERSTLTFGYVTPLGGGEDRFFDGELRALYNWRFGPQNRFTRAQF